MPRTRPTPTDVRAGMLPRLLLVVLVGVVAVVLVVTTWALGHSGDPAEPRAAATPSGGGQAGPAELAVLRAWDRRRARAWAAGDVEALAGLYTERSAAGRRDIAGLRRWQRRGLRVEGLRLQVLRADLVRQTSRRLVLDVLDRVVAGRVVGAGDVRVLPVDAPTRRRIAWVRDEEEWRVAAVRPR